MCQFGSKILETQFFDIWHWSRRKEKVVSISEFGHLPSWLPIDPIDKWTLKKSLHLLHTVVPRVLVPVAPLESIISFMAPLWNMCHLSQDLHSKKGTYMYRAKLGLNISHYIMSFIDCEILLKCNFYLHLHWEQNEQKWRVIRSKEFDKLRNNFRKIIPVCNNKLVWKIFISVILILTTFARRSNS